MFQQTKIGRRIANFGGGITDAFRMLLGAPDEDSVQNAVNQLGKNDKNILVLVDALEKRLSLVEPSSGEMFEADHLSEEEVANREKVLKQLSDGAATVAKARKELEL